MTLSVYAPARHLRVLVQCGFCFRTAEWMRRFKVDGVNYRACEDCWHG